MCRARFLAPHNSGPPLVSLWLGHASLQSTEVYVRADPREKLEALASPRAGQASGHTEHDRAQAELC